MEHPGAPAVLAVDSGSHSWMQAGAAQSQQQTLTNLQTQLEHTMAMKSIKPSRATQAIQGCYPLKYSMSGWSNHLSVKIIQGVL